MDALRTQPRISMADMVAEFCGQDAWQYRRLSSVADAILVACHDRQRQGGLMVSAADFAEFQGFMAYAAREFAVPAILSREPASKPDNVVSNVFGARLELSGEPA